jgi:hypothetical protein
LASPGKARLGCFGVTDSTVIKRTALEYDPAVATTLKELKEALDLARAASREAQALLS